MFRLIKSVFGANVNKLKDSNSCSNMFLVNSMTSSMKVSRMELERIIKKV